MTAGAICLGPDAFGALDGPEHWAFLSDVHIEANPATVSKQGVNMADNLRRVVAEVLAERDGLDAVVINGDCAYLEGIRGDYETLAGILAPLRQAGLPIHCTLGNHDDRGSFQAALADLCPAAAPVDGKVISVVEGRCAHWVFLDSLRFVNKVEGEFGPQQLAWLEQHLRAQTAKPVILVGHHYPQAYRDDLIPGDQKIPIAGLIDGEAFLTLANRVPNVKAYIYGHSHDWRITASETKLHEVNLPPTAYVFNPARPSGWVRAKVDATGMTLELKALDQTHPEHGMTRTLSWR